METKLALQVEWANGIVSNELQEGVEPKFIIIKEKLKIDIEDAKKLFEKAPSRRVDFLLQVPKDVIFDPQKDFYEKLEDIFSTLEGLGFKALVGDDFFWRSDSPFMQIEQNFFWRSDGSLFLSYGHQASPKVRPLLNVKR